MSVATPRSVRRELSLGSSFRSELRSSIVARPSMGNGRSRFRATPAVLLCCWLVWQVLAGVASNVNVPGAHVFLFGKAFVGPASIVLAWVLAGGRIRVPRRFRGMFVFGLWGAVNAATQGGDLLMGALFASWSVCMFAMLPGIVSGGVTSRGYFRLSFGVLVVCCLLVAWVVMREWGTLVWHKADSERVRYGFGMNPAYTAKIAAALVLAAVGCLVTFAIRKRWLLWCGVSLGVIGVVVTDTRTMLLFLVVFGVVFWVETRRRVRLLWSGLSALSLGVGLTALYAWSSGLGDYEGANAYSSGRLEIWRMLLDYNFAGADLALWLTGNGVTEWPVVWASVRTDPEGTVVSALARPHADSLYVDTLCAHGLVGIGLLVYGLASWWISLGRSRALERGWVRASLLAVAVAGVTDTVFPSFGNAINAAVLVGCVIVSSGLGGGKCSAKDRVLNVC